MCLFYSPSSTAKELAMASFRKAKENRPKSVFCPTTGEHARLRLLLAHMVSLCLVLSTYRGKNVFLLKIVISRYGLRHLLMLIQVLKEVLLKCFKLSRAKSSNHIQP